MSLEDRRIVQIAVEPRNDHLASLIYGLDSNGALWLLEWSRKSDGAGNLKYPGLSWRYLTNNFQEE